MNIKKKLLAWDKLYTELNEWISSYIISHEIRPYEDFHDFFIKDDDSIGVTFCDDEGNESFVYTTITFEDLQKFINNPFKVSKDKRYVCIKSLFVDDKECFYKGEMYQPTRDFRFMNEQGDDHYFFPEDHPQLYFKEYV